MGSVAAERERLAGLAGRVAHLFDRPEVFRWYPVALAVGGALVIVSGLYNVLVAAGVLDALSGYELYADEYRPRRILHALLFSAVLAGWVLVPAGLSSLRFLTRGRTWRGLAKWGALSAVAAAAFVLCVVTYRWLDSYVSGGPSDAYLFYGTGICWLVGMVLVGSAALRVRGLGRWKMAPVVLAVVGSPLTWVLAQPLVSVLLPPPEYPFIEPPVVFELIFWGPQMLAGVGWIALARPLARVPERERTLTVEENLALAGRLYREAWAGGDLSVVDEVAAPDCDDHYGDGHGPASLKRSAAGLRHSFPDLRFVVEQQEAVGDTVTTRWRASGTDLGGVLWYPPTGKAAIFSGVFTDRFANGRLVEHRGESDMAGLLEQLELPPASVR